MAEEMHVIVTGRVQGVGFRATAKYHADLLKLSGFARNLADGSVEICAQGEKRELETFLTKLKEEFDGGNIHHIQLRFQKISERYPAFKIF
jgi:acylphosphatase